MDAEALKYAFAKIQFDRTLAMLASDDTSEPPDLAPLRDCGRKHKLMTTGSLQTGEFGSLLSCC
jgi:hypothetical protein